MERDMVRWQCWETVGYSPINILIAHANCSGCQHPFNVPVWDVIYRGWRGDPVYLHQYDLEALQFHLNPEQCPRCSGVQLPPAPGKISRTETGDLIVTPAEESWIIRTVS